MMDFFKEGDVTEEEVEEQYQKTLHHIEDLEFRNMLSDEGDSMSAVLQITAGAGGTESCDWASMLMRMYLMWGEKQGYKIKELNNIDDEVKPGQVIKIPSAYAKKSTFYIDKSTSLPIYHKMEDEKGIYEIYEFKELKLGVTLTDADFEFN